MTRRILRLADECCGGRAVFVQEGGYSALHMPFCGAATVAVLLGVESGVRDVASWLDALPGQELQPHQRSAVEHARAAAADSGAVRTEARPRETLS
jgi:acetoin utilization deacetylase AcuC-like enzyme